MVDQSINRILLSLLVSHDWFIFDPLNPVTKTLTRSIVLIFSIGQCRRRRFLVPRQPSFGVNQFPHQGFHNNRLSRKASRTVPNMSWNLPLRMAKLCCLWSTVAPWVVTVFTCILKGISVSHIYVINENLKYFCWYMNYNGV